MKEIKGDKNKNLDVSESSCLTPNTEMEFDVERIQALTFAKIHAQTEERQAKHMNKIGMRILIAAALTVVISGTVWAANHYGLFANVFDNADVLDDQEVQVAGQSVENADVKITVEQMASDGYQHDMIISAKPKTEHMKHILERYGICANMVLLEEQEKCFGGGGMESWYEEDDEEKIYYHISWNSAEKIEEQEVMWTFTWKKWDEQEALTEPLEITVFHKNTMGEEKTLNFPEHLPIQEFRLRAFSAEVIGNMYAEEQVSVALVWKDGSEKQLGQIGGADQEMAQNSWLDSELVKSVGTDYNEENGEIRKYLNFSHIIKPEDVSGVRIDDTFYPFVK